MFVPSLKCSALLLISLSLPLRAGEVTLTFDHISSPEETAVEQMVVCLGDQDADCDSSFSQDSEAEVTLSDVVNFLPQKSDGANEEVQDPVAPKIVSRDLEFYFAFGSDEPLLTSIPDIELLAQAISDERLSNKTFMIFGHTDSVGTEERNKELSERRANQICEQLILYSGLSPSQFIAVGQGETELKDRLNPKSAVNRRVQFVVVGG